jgi:tetratricopeptide (TPR) repeat protein
MPLPSIYSRRKRQAQAVDDVYIYDQISKRVRVQVVQILSDGLGSDYYRNGDYTESAKIYDELCRQMSRELGVHELYPSEAGDNRLVFLCWLEREQVIDNWLDGVELALKAVDRFVRGNIGALRRDIRMMPDAVIAELNARLREAGLGYEYIDGIIISKDSEFLHREAVLPALRLLKDERFEAADKEFREAHEAFRQNRLEDCIVGCCKALESVLKVIGISRGWEIKENDPASKLIQAAVEAGFLPSYSQTALNHLRGLIESSTPTIRNKMGGHGAGETIRTIPRHLASFQLHQTAAVVLFLAEQDAS